MVHGGRANECAHGASGELQRLLIIEDNHDAADSLAELLKMLGYDVRVAYTGLEGVKVADEWRPTTVLSDIGLPELDGFEVARHVRTTATTAAAKLIAVTAYGAEEDRRRARQAGFNHYM